MPIDEFWDFINKKTKWGLRYFEDDKKTMEEVIPDHEDMAWFQQNHESFHARMLMEVGTLNSYAPVREFFKSKTIVDTVVCLKHVIMKGKDFYNAVLQDPHVECLDDITAPNPEVPIFAIDFESLYETWKKTLENEDDVMRAI